MRSSYFYSAFLMKLLLAFAAAGLLRTAGAQAQTVLPSGAVAPTGAVAPSGAIITPGTVPGSQPVVAPASGDGGSQRSRRRDEKIPGLDRQDRKELRKLRKVGTAADENGKVKKQ